MREEEDLIDAVAKIQQMRNRLAADGEKLLHAGQEAVNVWLIFLHLA